MHIYKIEISYKKYDGRKRKILSNNHLLTLCWDLGYHAKRMNRFAVTA